jgi:uncharacterized SAM-binding protein YcdF (DUF218 family)
MIRRKRIFTRPGGAFGPRRRRWLKRLGVPAVFLLAGWLIGLIQFSQAIPTRPSEDGAKTDAIVVLTGGSDRLREGLRLLAEGGARQLLISGVHELTETPALLETAGLTAEIWPSTTMIDCCVTVGYEAGDTRGNAREAAQWMAARGLKSLRLVTADYHMPRSLIEFRAAMPEIEILPHPVFPETVKRDQWWLWPGTTSLIVREYHKYLLAMLRVQMQRLARPAA